MRKIQDKNRYYNLLLKYLMVTFPMAYRKIERRNLDAIPKDGAVIFAPNHANTLMDAFAVLITDGKPKVFVARADIFKKKTMSDILHFFKMLPINRIRDGVENLAANDAIMKQCVEVLCDGVPFCILPEGRHRPMHSLLPLKKGIARIAFEAYDQIKDRMPIYIVPVGLEYEDYFEFRSRLLINVGKPLHLQEFVAEHAEYNEQELYRHLLLDLSERMKDTIIYLPDDERYEGAWEAANILSGRDTAASGNLLERKRRIQSLAERLLKRHPNIIERARRQAERRKKFGIRLRSRIDRKEWWELVIRGLLLILYSPFVLLEAVLLLPALVFTGIIKKKLKDITFINSIRYVACYVLNPIVMLIVCLAALFFAPWWACLAAYLLSWIAPIAVYDWSNAVRHLYSDLKYRQYRKAIE